MSLLEHCRKFNGDPTFGGLVTAWRTYHVLNEQNKVYNDPYFTAATDYLLDLYKEIVDLNCKHAVGIFVQDAYGTINRLDAVSRDLFLQPYTKYKPNVVQLSNKKRFAYFGDANAVAPHENIGMCIPVDIITGCKIIESANGVTSKYEPQSIYTVGSTRTSLLKIGIETEVSTSYWHRIL